MPSSSSAIYILLVDDHPALRMGIRLMLSADPSLHVIGEASSGAEALQQYGVLKPDVVLLDVRLPDFDGFEVLRRLRLIQPESRVIFFSSSAMPHEVKRARELGAVGFLQKDIEFNQLRQAILTVHSGSAHWPESLRPQRKAIVSSREMDVLECLTRGLTNDDIAKALNISLETVKSHVKSLLVKLDAADRTEAVARAYQLGLVGA